MKYSKYIYFPDLKQIAPLNDEKMESTQTLKPAAGFIESWGNEPKQANMKNLSPSISPYFMKGNGPTSKIR